MITGESARRGVASSLLAALHDADDDYSAIALFILVECAKCGMLPSQKADTDARWWCWTEGATTALATVAGDPAGSSWSPYLALLPRPHDLAGIPATWPTSAWAALQDSSWVSSLASVRSMWEAEHAQLCSRWPSSTSPTLGDWAWARCVVRSRVFLDGLFVDPMFMSPEAAHMLGVVLVPLADLLNHVPGSPCFESDWVGLEDEEADEAGDARSSTVGRRGAAAAASDDADEEMGGKKSGDPASSSAASSSTKDGWFILVAPTHEPRDDDAATTEPSSPSSSAGAILPAGHQIIISYGERSAQDLLDTYGFIPRRTMFPTTATSAAAALDEEDAPMSPPPSPSDAASATAAMQSLRPVTTWSSDPATDFLELPIPPLREAAVATRDAAATDTSDALLARRAKGLAALGLPVLIEIPTTVVAGDAVAAAQDDDEDDDDEDLGGGGVAVSHPWLGPPLASLPALRVAVASSAELAPAVKAAAAMAEGTATDLRLVSVRNEYATLLLLRSMLAPIADGRSLTAAAAAAAAATSEPARSLSMQLAAAREEVASRTVQFVDTVLALCAPLISDCGVSGVTPPSTSDAPPRTTADAGDEDEPDPRLAQVMDDLEASCGWEAGTGASLRFGQYLAAWTEAAQR